MAETESRPSLGEGEHTCFVSTQTIVTGLLSCSSVLDPSSWRYQSAAAAPCEQPTSSATALPFPLKLGGKQGTAITYSCMLFDLLLQLKFILVGEAFDRPFASQRLSPWSWVGSVPVAMSFALLLN